MLPPQQNWLQLLQVLPFPKKSVTGNAFCLSLYMECCAVLSHVSRVRLFGTPWTVGCWAPLSMGFSRQEYWSGLPRPFPGGLPSPGSEPASLTSSALAGVFFPTKAAWEAPEHRITNHYLCLGAKASHHSAYGIVLYIQIINVHITVLLLKRFIHLTKVSCLENSMDRGAWWAIVQGGLRVRHS